MIQLISHRGNIDGPQPKFENTICYIDYALSKGYYDVEIDVWKLPDEDCFRLGHDKPIMNESVPLRYLEENKFWIHCKNVEAFDCLFGEFVNCFWHTDENWVKTTSGYNWIHSRFSPAVYGIDNEYNNRDNVFTWFVDKPKNKYWKLDKMNYGICSDYVSTYL